MDDSLSRFGAHSKALELFDHVVSDLGAMSSNPALQRLEQKGWISSAWRTSDANRRAKYYHLTALGRRALGAETSNWRRYVDAVDLILET